MQLIFLVVRFKKDIDRYDLVFVCIFLRIHWWIIIRDKPCDNFVCSKK